VTVDVASQPDVLTPFTFTYVVPGHQNWTLRSVRAQAVRVPGGIPNRGYLLTITNGTDIVAQAGAVDAGTEPGTCDVTWCGAAGSATTLGAIGIVVAALPNLVVPAGYDITGTIVNPAVGDGWVGPTVWLDYTPT
jgi:hypothetical protein